MEALGNAEFCDNFLRGQKDCMDGIPHQSGKGEAYDRGYAAQYQHEQNMSALSDLTSLRAN